MKKILFYVLALALFVLAFGCGNQEKGGEKEVVKIGAILPLTGNYAWFGELNANSIKLAVDIINQENEKKIELILLDNKSTVKDGINSTLKLISNDGVNAIISTPSSLSLAINEILRSHKNITHIALSANSNILENEVSVVRAYLSAEDDAKELSEFVKENVNFNRIVAFTINDDYGLSFFKSFKNMMNDSIINVIINYGQQDFKNSIMKLNLRSNDIVIIIEHGTQASYNLIKQIKDYNMDIKVFGNSSIASSPIVKQLNPNYLNGIICSTTPFDLGELNEKAKILINKYNNKYGKTDVNLGQSYAFDAVNNFYKISDFINGQDIKIIYSERFKNEIGTIGEFSYTSAGDIKSPTTIGIFNKGNFEPYK